MNIVLFESSEIIENHVVFQDERAKHIVKVLRAAPGDSIRIGVVDGLSGYGVITGLERRPPYRVEMDISLDEIPPPPSCVDIVLALPRPIMFKRVLSQATSLGVKNFHIVNASRVEKSYWDASVISESIYHNHLLRGLEQAVDTRLPNVFFHRSFKTFIECTIPELKTGYGCLIAADPRFPCLALPKGTEKTGRVLLAVGPEGGWLDYEIEKMLNSGFMGVGIGTRILRVDTAVIALHSVLANMYC